MMGLGPKCYIPSFVEIGQMVLEKKILKCFNIYVHGGRIGHVTSIMSLNCNYLVPKSLHTKFCLKWPSGF